MVFQSIGELNLEDYRRHCYKSILFKNNVRNLNDGKNMLIENFQGQTSKKFAPLTRGGETKMTDEKTKVAPCKKFVAFPVTASIWKNKKEIDGEKRVFYSVSVQKCYKDGDEWKNTTSLNPMDLPKSILVQQEAYKYIAMMGKEPVEEKEE